MKWKKGVVGEDLPGELEEEATRPDEGASLFILNYLGSTEGEDSEVHQTRKCRRSIETLSLSIAVFGPSLDVC